MDFLLTPKGGFDTLPPEPPRFIRASREDSLASFPTVHDGPRWPMLYIPITVHL